MSLGDPKKRNFLRVKSPVGYLFSAVILTKWVAMLMIVVRELTDTEAEYVVEAFLWRVEDYRSYAHANPLPSGATANELPENFHHQLKSGIFGSETFKVSSPVDQMMACVAAGYFSDSSIIPRNRAEIWSAEDHALRLRAFIEAPDSQHTGMNLEELHEALRHLYGAQGQRGTVQGSAQLALISGCLSAWKVGMIHVC